MSHRVTSDAERAARAQGRFELSFGEGGRMTRMCGPVATAGNLTRLRGIRRLHCGSRREPAMNAEIS